MQDMARIVEPEILKLGNGARALLMRFEWCRRVARTDVGFAIPGRLGVFRFQIEPSSPSVPSIIWMVFGDLIPAYLVGEALSDWRVALVAYVEMMERWVANVVGGGNGKGIIPIDVEASADSADAMTKRLHFLRETVLGDPNAELPPLESPPVAPADNMAVDAREFANRVGNEMLTILRKRSQEELGGETNSGRMAASLGAALVPVSECLRVSIAAAKSPQAMREEMLAITMKMLAGLLDDMTAS